MVDQSLVEILECLSVLLTPLLPKGVPARGHQGEGNEPRKPRQPRRHCHGHCSKGPCHGLALLQAWRCGQDMAWHRKEGSETQ